MHIGPVFTRVHLLKDSCKLEKPFVFFFDLCQKENPCLNGGTCKSQTPNYEASLSNSEQMAEIDYSCYCPPDTSGEHCQNTEYPFGYCINGGILVETIGENGFPKKMCQCEGGFQGEHCEYNVDDCVGISCSHRGVCQDGINQYTCACFDGFSGEYCQNTSFETEILLAVTRSFATVAILLIVGIALLFLASDIHTYLTRETQLPRQRLQRVSARRLLKKKPRQVRKLGNVYLEMDKINTGSSRNRTDFIPSHPTTGYQSLLQNEIEKDSSNIDSDSDLDFI